VELFRTHSPNTPAFEIAKPFLPAVFAGIIQGATLKGSAGVADRHTLFRILGAPWTPSSSQRGEIANNLDALADRLIRAVSRREQRALGREPVTIDVDANGEAQPSAG
jgi:hypothetical protein